MALVQRLNRGKQNSPEPTVFKITYNNEELALNVQWVQDKKSELVVIFDGPKSFGISRTDQFFKGEECLQK